MDKQFKAYDFIRVLATDPDPKRLGFLLECIGAERRIDEKQYLSHNPVFMNVNFNNSLAGLTGLDKEQALTELETVLFGQYGRIIAEYLLRFKS